ncbi:ribonuclease H-like domain-containing protein [Tanacetum coccineum]
MALPEDHLAKFYKMTDAKDMWDAIKSRFGGNDESKKMQKYILKQQFEGFSVSNSEGLHKGYDSGPHLDHEDLEQLDEFDLEGMDLKWQVAIIFIRLKKFYKKTGRRLQFDAKELVGFDKTKVECFNCHNTGHFTRECISKGNQESRRRDAGNTGYRAKDNGRRPRKQEEPKALAQTLRDKSGLGYGDQVLYSSFKKGQMSSGNKYGLGYGNQIHEGVLSYEKEVLESVFDSRSSDVEDSPVNDRFAKAEGMHAVPPPMTGNYMPPKFDFGIDDVETLESVPEPVVVEPKVVSQPKVWSDAPIIEEYESDSDDEYVIEPSKEQEKPSFDFVNTDYAVKSPRETIKEPKTHVVQVLKLTRETGMACFVCGSFSHLIRDYDFHKKRMAKQFELNKKKGKGTSQGKNRPVWNNVQRLNHQNKFVPKAVLTKTGRFPVNTARHNLSSQAAETSTARKVNTARQNLSSQTTKTSTARKVNTGRPIVNEIKPRNTFYKSHSPIRRPFNKSTTPKANFTNHKVNTAGDKTVSAVRGYRETAVKASAGEAHDVYYALKYDWKDLLHQTKSVKHIGKSKEVGTLRYLSLVVPLTKVGDEAIYKELGDKMERAATTASSLKAEQDNGSGPSNHMANLEFCDKHNMIAYLQKSEGSEGFHQIIDFLNASHIQYALIENPTIYVSFIKQFWRTATARTSATGEVELTATIDGQEKTITEASLRRHLKLEDNGGVTTLPNSEIFEQLDLMGPMQLILIILTFQKKIFSNMKRVTKGYSGEDIPLFASMITASETSPSRSHLHHHYHLNIHHLLPHPPPNHQTSTPHLLLRKLLTCPMNHLSKVFTHLDVMRERSLIEELDLDVEISLVPPHDAEIQKKINESVQKKSKKQLEQERLSHEEAIRLQEQIDEEERKRIARDAKIAKQLQEEYDKAGKQWKKL